MSLKRIGVVVQGRVQGVGYRMFVRDVAYQYQIAGWVRNRYDGTVEAVLEGETEMVDDALDALYARGSHIIRVDSIAITQKAPIGESGFEIRR